MTGLVEIIVFFIYFVRQDDLAGVGTVLPGIAGTALLACRGAGAGAFLRVGAIG
ncbi:MAG: hypothetical protein M3Z09_05220 [Acidobacteriota bacterium]|nr:hypothetical protein [Acidobacteriota bacterium]